MGLIKNLAFRFVIGVVVAYSISQQFPAYVNFILIGVFIALFILRSHLAKKF